MQELRDFFLARPRFPQEENSGVGRSCDLDQFHDLIPTCAYPNRLAERGPSPPGPKILQFPSHRALVEGALEHQDHDFRTNRFQEIIVCASLHALDCGRDSSMTGKNDYGD